MPSKKRKFLVSVLARLNTDVEATVAVTAANRDDALLQAKLKIARDEIPDSAFKAVEKGYLSSMEVGEVTPLP